MVLIEWQEAFNLGIESVDREHRELLRLINELHETILDRASGEDVLQALEEMVAQLTAHFAIEESMMLVARYGGYAEHRDDHEVLLEELLDLMEEIQVDGIYDEARLTQDLMRWFGEHFRTHDARLHGVGG